MSADPARASLDARILAWMQEPDPQPDERRFEQLALELFAFQFEHCEPYRRFCSGRERTPSKLTSWNEIPAVPSGAFKELALRSFDAGRTCKTFRTSGTSAQRRGELHLDTLRLYEASLLWSFRRFVLPDLVAPGARMRMRVLAPSPEEAPESSLSHMFGRALEEFGAPGSGFDVVEGTLRSADLSRAAARAAGSGTPLVLCGTAFAFVHWLDALEAGGRTLRLPPGSRVMETGGFKGRSREVSRDALHAALEAGLGIPRSRVVNQYGMTELGSQFYDSVLFDPAGARRKLAPPWARVQIVDPLRDEPVARGQVGAIRIFDLANSGSVLAIQTADVGRRLEQGFEVLGREPGAEARGCSIAADEMMQRVGA